MTGPDRPTTRAGRLRWAARYAFRPKGLLAAIVGATLLRSLLGALGPLPLKVLVDNAIGGAALPAWMQPFAPGSARRLVLWSAGAFVGISVASALLGSLTSWLWTVAGMRTVRDLMVDTFDALQHRSLAFHAARSTGDSVDRIVTDGWVGYTIMQALLVTPITETFSIAVVLAAAMRLNLALSAVMVAASVVATVVGFAAGGALKARADENRAVDGAFAGEVHTLVVATPLVRAHRAEALAFAAYGRASSRAISAAVTTAVARRVAEAVPAVVDALGVAVVLGFGATLVNRGELTLGALLVFLAYATKLRASVAALLATDRSLRAAEANIDRLVEVLEGGGVLVERAVPVGL
ncbi:MAG: ABC transporter transmembrane domain-containing protein, partial [Acidimicrobiia bacterium]|nr:ABC transporter transmembrane domain-containing protein [Acidimicrobiia bacterium]